MEDQAEIHRMTLSTEVLERRHAINDIVNVFSLLPDKKQAWKDLHLLTNDTDSYVRGRAAEVVGTSFLFIHNKHQAWADLHRLTEDTANFVRSCAAEVLGIVYYIISDRKPVWDDIQRLTTDKISFVRERAVDAVCLVFSEIPDKWQPWNYLHRLTKDQSSRVRLRTAIALGSSFNYIPDKSRVLAEDDLFRLTLDKNDEVRRGATNSLGFAFSNLPDKTRAFANLIQLAQDVDSNVRASANYSLGRASIFNANEAQSEETLTEQLRTAIDYFENSMVEAIGSGNPARFCLPFYRSFFLMAFKKQVTEAEIRKYLAEARSICKGSISKEKLLKAVENLSNALKEVQRARDFNEIKGDLNAYRRYCDRACELLDTTEDKAPGASKLIRKGLPIIDERIKEIISEIQEKAKALCKETKGTAFENLGKDVNSAGQNLLNVRDPIGLEKQVQNMLIVLNSICSSMPEEERGDACEFLKKANDEHYIEDKLSSINMVLSKIPTNIRKAVVMTKIEIKNSTNTQVAVGNGNIQKIRTSTKPEYGLDEPKKPRKNTKSAISIDEKIQQKNEMIEQILDNWGFRPGVGKRDEKKADIKKWLHRFQLSEFEDAFLILERIQYHDSHIVDGYMEGLSGELKKIFDNDLSEILFYQLGESPASSGGNLLYSYRKDLGLPESSFPYLPFKDIDLSGKKAIVFFDDIIGSGNQAVRFAKNHLKNIKIDKYYVALMAFEKGLENVRNNGGFKKVIVHEIISEELRAFSPGSQVFPDADTREQIKRLCGKYGKLLYPKHPLGYDDSQALIVFPHNTPNNTLPIIWASEKNEKEPGYIWYPLWERIKKIEKK